MKYMNSQFIKRNGELFYFYIYYRTNNSQKEYFSSITYENIFEIFI